MARDPNKRAFSREVDKERKRARRAIERLEKQIAATSNKGIRRKARAQIADLQQDIANLSAKGKAKTYAEQAQESLSALRSKRVSSQKELLQQKIDFQAEMNAARRGDISMFSSKGRERVQLFYKATQPLWEGKPMAERNAAIIQALGVSSLSQAFIKVMNQKEVQHTWQQLNSSGGVIEDTDRMSQAYQQAKRTQYRTGSPIELQNPRLTEWTKAYGG